MFGKENFLEELVNIFNLYNYYYDSTDGNFTVEDGKIIGLFEHNVDIEKYFAAMKKEIIGHHCGTEDVASEVFDIKSFPFSAGEKSYVHNKDTKVKKLVINATPKVIFNLKFHSVLSFKKSIERWVAATLEDDQVTREDALDYVKACTQSRKANLPYLYYTSFGVGDDYDDDLRDTYITIFKSRLQACGLKSSDFYKDDGNEIYIKDINDVNVIKSIAEHVARHIALDFKTSGKEEPKIENLKNTLSDLIFKLTGQSIDGYDYKTFVNKNKQKDFAFIPLVEKNGLPEILTTEEASKINEVFKEKGWFKEDLFVDIRSLGRVLVNKPVYAISCKQLALLIPELMKSPIEYNEREKLFEYTVPLNERKVEEILDSHITTLHPTNPYLGGDVMSTSSDSQSSQDSEERVDSGLGNISPQEKPSTDLAVKEVQKQERSESPERSRTPERAL